MNRIRAARQALGWTQNELAEKAGISARTIHAVEKVDDFGFFNTVVNRRLHFILSLL